MASGMDRRLFLLSAGSLALVGCSSGSAETTTLVPLDSDSEALDLVVMFSPSVLAAGIPQRLPFGLMSGGVFVLGPGESEEVKIQLFNDSDGSLAFEGQVGGRVVAHAHSDGAAEDHAHDGVVRYFAPTLTIPEPGPYRLVVTSGDQAAGLGLMALDPQDVRVPGSGQPMPQLDTPTVGDPGDVDPICTRTPPCEFHSHTPAEMLDAGEPFVLLIATPAYCQTEFCGPVLDVLIDVQPDFPGLTMIHAEVYSNPAEVDGNFADPNLRVAPVLQELGMDYEPSLFIVGSDGLVVHRLDNVYDEIELRDSLRDVA